MVIGIIGESGSGKSYISQKLVEWYKFKYINADCVAHIMYDDPKSLANKLIYEKFGNKVMAINNKFDYVVDRKKLGKLVFNRKEQMRKLNKIMIPLIEWEIGYEIMQYAKENEEIIIDGALLNKTNILQYCDFVVVVYTNKNIRLKRLIKRGVTESIANKMVDAVNIDVIPISKDKIVSIENNKQPKGLKLLGKKILEYRINM